MIIKNRKYILRFIAIISVIMMACTASALPEILDAFNMKYNSKGTQLDTCALCHVSKNQKPSCDEFCHIPNGKRPKPQKDSNDTLNSYGADLQNNLNIPVSDALSKIEGLDSDGDKYTNIEEIYNMTFPGDKNDFPRGKNKNSLLASIINMFNI